MASGGFGGIIDDLTGFAGDIFDAVLGTHVTQSLNEISGVFGFLTTREGWIRIFMVLFGFLLLYGALKYGTQS